MSQESRSIRIRILLALYQKYYGNEGGAPQLTDRIIQEAQLDWVDINILQGEIIYLKRAGLIEGEYILGVRYPYTISITNGGIDVVQRWLDDFLPFLRKKDAGKSDQLRAMRSHNFAAMMTEFYEYVRQKPDIIDSFMHENRNFIF